VWRRLSLRRYSYSFKFFRFSATGVFQGWTIIRQTAVVDPGGDAYTSQGGAEVYDTQGVQVGSGCSTIAATRLE
jgi:hypothetical protein